MPDTESGKNAGFTCQVEKLHSLIRSMERVGVAFSGGVDSTFLLSSCLRELGAGSVAAIMVDHPLMDDREVREAVGLAEELGADVHILQLDPRVLKEVSTNAVSRCYHCKLFIFSSLLKFAEEKNLPFILEGTNADDSRGYRPGIKALEELGIRSPLRESGLTKKMVRELSRSEGLKTWDKPSAPCLATRFPYDHPVTDEDLERVKQGEAILREEGFSENRLRVHGDLARIEVPVNMVDRLNSPELRQRLVAVLKTLGYRYVTVDLEGLRSGSMDEGFAATTRPDQI